MYQKLAVQTVCRRLFRSRNTVRCFRMVSGNVAKQENVIIWFRKGLRLHDNPALLRAVQDARHLFPVFCLDPYFLTQDRVGVNRMKFLLESLEDLHNSLTARGSQLLVLKGNPVDLLPQAFKAAPKPKQTITKVIAACTKTIQAWKITKLCFEADTEPYAKVRDARVAGLAAASGIELITPVSHTLYDPEQIVMLNGGKTPTTYAQFQKLVAKAGPPPVPARDPPNELPALPERLGSWRWEDVGVPTLPDIGYPDTATTHFHGGETVALARMADQLADKDWVARFEKPKGDPSAFQPKPATTVLSPYLKFGCLSPRLFYSELQKIEKAKKGKVTKPPVSLFGQLLWREFFYTAGATIPNFDVMEGNPICKQIPWDDHNEEFYRAWDEARTGYPWIDAIMMQLHKEGWMHHLARHCVACFLTRGDLYISWMKGRDTFDRLLIDGDWSINNGNWMWLSASAFFYKYFRVYSPITFGQKYDKNGDYVRHFLPVLKDFPAKYIYKPWEAPLETQRAAGCIIGKDYPRPVVDHATVSKINIERHRQAYADNARVVGEDRQDRNADNGTLDMGDGAGHASDESSGHTNAAHKRRKS